MDQTDCSFLLHVDFEAQARRTPEAVALRCGAASITFADLKRRSDHLAVALRAGGIEDRAYVGLHVDRSIDYVACVLAILKCNSAVVPLPPAYPRARLAEILSFAELDAVVDTDTSRLPPVSTARVLHLDDLDDDRADPVTIGTGQPGQPAFVLCSSGSTGKPKMIVRSHRSFYHRLRWTWQNHPYQAGERCCQKSTMTTTHALYELFEPLLRGVPVLIIDDPDARNLEQFWRTINEQAISRLLVVPSALQVSLDFPGFAVPSLRVVVLMGEYVHHRLAGRAIDAFPEQTRIYSIYGSTEASSTLVCDLKESYRPDQELPLGKPISAEVQACVLGPDLAPVARGDTGLLHFGGTALFTEYFRDPALTESVFVRSPVYEGPLYDTHDQVRLTEDGNLQYVGRTDHTVKVRGFRVDLQEVERTLLLHPEIRQAAVGLASGDAANASLLGFFAPESAGRASVRRFLQEQLPAYMVPSVLVGLESLPRTTSGKTDRRRLLEEFASRASSIAPDTGQSTTEAEVCRIWRQVLGHGSVDADSSFFEVGGTSLNAFAAMQRLRDAFSLDRSQLPDQALYQFPTAQEIAGCIDRLRAGAAPAPQPGGNVLVPLSKGDDPSLPPLFLVASAGGTLGAYDKLTKALRTRRDVFGVRDPYVLGERDPTLGFRDWVTLYIDAMRQRQPQGPYYVVAYSSAGAFGYEIARRLLKDGQDVAQLVLIDPFGLDRSTPASFGYKVMQARFKPARFRATVRLSGWLRALISGMRQDGAADAAETVASFSAEDVDQRIRVAKLSKADLMGFSALLELNTGTHFAMTDADLSSLNPEQYFPAFLQRVAQVAPELDPQVVDRIYSQYFGLQVPAQQGYRLRRYDGAVTLVEIDGPSRGLVSAQLRPHVRRLRVARLKVGPTSHLRQALARSLSRGLRDHYLCMRDDVFVTGLAAELENTLK
jgi:enterobactin synthetase component F